MWTNNYTQITFFHTIIQTNEMELMTYKKVLKSIKLVLTLLYKVCPCHYKSQQCHAFAMFC